MKRLKSVVSSPVTQFAGFATLVVSLVKPALALSAFGFVWSHSGTLAAAFSGLAFAPADVPYVPQGALEPVALAFIVLAATYRVYRVARDAGAPRIPGLTKK
jgi:hypothetical protein